MAYVGSQLKANFLGIQTASNSASLSFTSILTSSYSNYLIRIKNILPVTDNSSLLMTWSLNNGSTYINSGYSWTQAFETPFNFSNNKSNSDSSMTIYANAPNTSGQGFCGDINLYNMADSVNWPNYITFISGYIDGGPAVNAIYGSGSTISAQNINAIKFAMSSGNISSGSLLIYGIQEN